MTKPGSRQQLAQLATEQLYRLMRPAPLEPMVSPCLPGFMTRKQAGDPR